MCGNPLGNTNHHIVDGKGYCKPCHVKSKKDEKRGDMCGRCKKPITGEFILLKMKKFHISHFNCAACKMVLGKGWGEYQSKYYCRNDYDRIINGSGQCFACILNAILKYQMGYYKEHHQYCAISNEYHSRKAGLDRWS
jgi:hypothetical protein